MMTEQDRTAAEEFISELADARWWWLLDHARQCRDLLITRAPHDADVWSLDYDLFLERLVGLAEKRKSHQA